MYEEFSTQLRSTIFRRDVRLEQRFAKIYSKSMEIKVTSFVNQLKLSPSHMDLYKTVSSFIGVNPTDFKALGKVSSMYWASVPSKVTVLSNEEARFGVAYRLGIDLGDRIARFSFPNNHSCWFSFYAVWGW